MKTKDYDPDADFSSYTVSIFGIYVFLIKVTAKIIDTNGTNDPNDSSRAT